MTTAISVCFIFLLGGLVQGLTGFGAALVAIPLLCLFIDIKMAVPLFALNGIVITVVLAVEMRDSLSISRVLPLCLGALPGYYVGITIIKTLDPATMRFFLGLLLICYAIYNLCFTIKPRRLHRAYSLLAGFLSGSIGAGFSAGGPPAIIYTSLNDWSKDEIKSTLNGFFLFNSFMVAILHALSGVTTRASVMLFLISAPFVLAGTLGGAYLYRWVSGEKYRTLVFVFLLVMGVVMMDVI